jgi:hypothetical protein
MDWLMPFWLRLYRPPSCRTSPVTEVPSGRPLTRPRSLAARPSSEHAGGLRCALTRARADRGRGRREPGLSLYRATVTPRRSAAPRRRRRRRSAAPRPMVELDVPGDDLAAQVRSSSQRRFACGASKSLFWRLAGVCARRL